MQCKRNPLHCSTAVLQNKKHKLGSHSSAAEEVRDNNDNNNDDNNNNKDDDGKGKNIAQTRETMAESNKNVTINGS